MQEYPPRESAVSPRNNTGKEKRASGHKRGEEEYKVRGDEMLGEKTDEMRGSFNC